ncbi:MAG: 50S ribosomal protein L22 [Bacteroidota bacterium]
MEAIARYNNIRISPRKTRKVVDLIRAMRVTQAIEVLQHLSQKAAPYIINVLRSAVANLNQQHQGKSLLSSAIVIKEIYVNMGPVLKRIQPAPQGRAHPIRKPRSHIFVKVYLDEAQQSKPLSPQKSAKKLLNDNAKFTTSPPTLPPLPSKGEVTFLERTNGAPKLEAVSLKAKAETTQEGTSPKAATNNQPADALKKDTSTAKPTPSNPETS